MVVVGGVNSDYWIFRSKNWNFKALFMKTSEWYNLFRAMVSIFDRNIRSLTLYPDIRPLTLYVPENNIS